MQAIGVLLLFVTLSLVSAQDWWGVNNVGCIQGNVPTADENVPKHLQWARFLVDKVISGQGNSTYDHVAGPIYWGSYSCNSIYTSVSDCNGFNSAILLQAYNLVIAAPAGFNHAYASTYWHAFVDQTFGFERIHDVAAIQVGDLIAYNYLYGLNDSIYLATQNSGHLVVVNSVPTVAATAVAPIIPDTIQWSVGVIDQTSDPHYTTDSRWNIATGLGTGYMRLYTSASNGTFVGYAWSFSPSTVFYYNDVIRSPAIGRLTTYPITGCGVSITQSLLSSWAAGNDAIPYTQWGVTIHTSSKQVNSLEILIAIPPGASFSYDQLQPVAGKPNTYTIVDWHFSSGLPLPTNYEFNFDYIVSSATQPPVYVATSSC